MWTWHRRAVYALAAVLGLLRGGDPSGLDWSVDVAPQRVELVPPTSVARVRCQTPDAEIEVGRAEVIAWIDQRVTELRARGRTGEWFSSRRAAVASATEENLCTVLPNLVADLLDRGHASIRSRVTGAHVTRLDRRQISWEERDKSSCYATGVSRIYTEPDAYYEPGPIGDRCASGCLFESVDQIAHIYAGPL